MRLAVIGATSRTGRHVLRGARARGYLITAFTRRPELLEDRAALDRLVQGDGRDPLAIRRAVEGVDAVIAIVAGSGLARSSHHQAAVARVLTAVTSEEGPRRLVMTSPYGLVARGPLAVVVRALLRGPYAESAEMERIVTASDLDWTIARFTMLTNDPPTRRIQISRDLLTDAPVRLPRADAARALLDVVADPSLARCAVNIAGRRA